MLETANDAQVVWSVFFVYGDREHIRFLLRNIFVENDNPDMVDAHFDQTADLWLIENGRRIGHVDLHSLISVPDDAGTGRVLIDWVRFDELVPAFLTGLVLRHGEELRLRLRKTTSPTRRATCHSCTPTRRLATGCRCGWRGS